MGKRVNIGKYLVGQDQPAFIIAEIGINHNGDLALARQLIDAAQTAGCNAVKFQKRTAELCVPEHYQNVMRETPWGLMTYLDYRKRVEFEQADYEVLDRYCRQKDMLWFASCWDDESVEFIEQFNPPCYKVASASLTDEHLLQFIRSKGRPIILSTGMSTMTEIRHAVSLLDQEQLVLMHSTSTYPCRPEELNLRCIDTLRNEFDCPIGYSGHEVGLQTTLAARVLGACCLERHITLDRAMWGTDQASSIEPGGFVRLVRDIRVIELAMGDGVKKVYDSEIQIREKLRKR